METDPAAGDANPKRLIWTATTVSSLEKSTRPSSAQSVNQN